MPEVLVTYLDPRDKAIIVLPPREIIIGDVTIDIGKMV